MNNELCWYRELKKLSWLIFSNILFSFFQSFFDNQNSLISMMKCGKKLNPLKSWRRNFVDTGSRVSLIKQKGCRDYDCRGNIQETGGNDLIDADYWIDHCTESCLLDNHTLFLLIAISSVLWFYCPERIVRKPNPKELQIHFLYYCFSKYRILYGVTGKLNK